jgi:hypothetical protein
MGNEERRGGLGFGNQRRVDAGGREASVARMPAMEDDAPPEATRAMDVDDIMPAPTEFVRQPAAPPPRSPAPRAPQPAPRQASRPPPPPAEEEEAATRMLEAMDYDPDAAPEPEVQLRSVELRVVQGPDRGKVHPVPEGSHLVGRGLDCQIVLADPAVSRKHFRVERQGDEMTLIDGGSANGTNVNGGKVQRKLLETGDQIEIGTSVLEVWIEGSAPKARDRKTGGHAPEPMKPAGREPPTREVDDAAARGGGKKKGGPAMIIGIAAIGVVVLIGGAVCAWLVFKGGDDTAKEGKEGEAGAKAEGASEGGEGSEELQKLVKEAKAKLGDNDFSGALETLKSARKLDKGNAEVKDLIKAAQREIEAQEAIDEAKGARREQRFDQALARLGEIDKESALHAEAQEAMAEAKQALYDAKMDEYKKANEAGDNAAALKALDAILKADPARADVKALKAQLEGGGGAAAGGEAPAGGEKAAAAAPGKDPAAAVVATGGKKPDFKQGLDAYHNRNWSAAVQAFEGVSQAGAKADKAKATLYLTAVKQVEAALNEAGAAGTNARKAATAYKVAYEADKRIDGHHGSFIAGKIAEAYLAVAKTAFAAKNYADATDAVRESLNFGEKPDALALEEKCVAQAGAMLKQAKDDFSKGNYASAGELARKVMRIVQSMDPRAAEAQDIVKKATAASTKDED